MSGNLRLDKILANTIKNDNGCLIWQGAKGRVTGYGTVSIKNKNVYVHRYVAAYYAGLTLDDLNRHDVVRHTCDNTKCINPEHLIIGTQAENVQDSFAKGRIPTRGEARLRAKLTEEDVLAIRNDYYNGVLQKDLAEKYGVTSGNISMIINKVNWRHI